MPGGHAHGINTLPHFEAETHSRLPSHAVPKTKDSGRRHDFSSQKRTYLFVKNILSPNVGLTCKVAWRTAGSASGVTGGLVRFKLLLGDYQIASAHCYSEEAVTSNKSGRTRTM
jgi:hypothetical protein